MKSCKREKSEKFFDATRFCHRGNFLEKFYHRSMCVKRRFQFYIQTHNCIRHHVTKRQTWIAFRPVGQAVTCLSLEREVLGSNLGRSNRTQCCQGLATAATLLRKKLCCPGAMTRRWASQTRYTLRRNSASIIKDLISFKRLSLRSHKR